MVNQPDWVDPLSARLRGLKMPRWGKWRLAFFGGEPPGWFLMPEKLFSDEPVAVQPENMFGLTYMVLGRTERTGCRYLLTISCLVPDDKSPPLPSAPTVHAAHCKSEAGPPYLVGSFARSASAAGKTAVNAVTLRVETRRDSFDGFLRDQDAVTRRLSQHRKGWTILSDGDIDWVQFTYSYEHVNAPVAKRLFGKWPSRLTNADLDLMEHWEDAQVQKARQMFEDHPELAPPGAPPLLAHAPNDPTGIVDDKLFALIQGHFKAAEGSYSYEMGDDLRNQDARSMEELAFPWRAFVIEFGPRDIDTLAAVISQVGGLAEATYRDRVRASHACATEMSKYHDGDSSAIHAALRSYGLACTPANARYERRQTPGEQLFLLHMLLPALRPVLVRDQTFCCCNCLTLFARPDGLDGHKWDRRVYCSEGCQKAQEERRREFRKDLAREFPELAGDRFGLDFAAILLTLDGEDKERVINKLQEIKDGRLPSMSDSPDTPK